MLKAAEVLTVLTGQSELRAILTSPHPLSESSDCAVGPLCYHTLWIRQLWFSGITQLTQISLAGGNPIDFNSALGEPKARFKYLFSPEELRTEERGKYIACVYQAFLPCPRAVTDSCSKYKHNFF